MSPVVLSALPTSVSPAQQAYTSLLLGSSGLSGWLRLCLYFNCSTNSYRLPTLGCQWPGKQQCRDNASTVHPLSPEFVLSQGNNKWVNTVLISHRAAAATVNTKDMTMAAIYYATQSYIWHCAIDSKLLPHALLIVCVHSHLKPTVDSHHWLYSETIDYSSIVFMPLYTYLRLSPMTKGV